MEAQAVAPTGESTRLVVEVEPGHDQLVLVLHGDLDRAGVAYLLAAVGDEPPRRVILDLAGTDAIDSAGMSLLVRLHRRLEADGGELLLRRPTGRVDHLLQAVGLIPPLRVRR